MKIALIYNRLFKAPTEEEHKINQIRRKRHIQTISETVQASGHEVQFIDDDAELQENLQALDPDLVFLQTFRVDPGAVILKIQQLLEALNIPYTGSPPEACRLAQNKLLAKQQLMRAGLPTPGYILVEKSQYLDKKPDHLQYPLFIKPMYGGCSMGIHHDNPVNSDREFQRVLSETLSHTGQSVLVEEFMSGREFTAGVLGNNPPDVLPLIEFVDEGKEKNQVPFRMFDAKTDAETQENIQCPADVLDEKAEEIQRLAVRAFSALGCRDYARVDLRLDGSGSPHILEVNVHPSLLPTSSLPIMADKAGIDYPQLMEHIFQIALSRFRDFAD